MTTETKVGWWVVVGHAEDKEPQASWVVAGREEMAVEDFLNKMRIEHWDGDNETEIYVDVVVFCGRDCPVVSVY